MLPSSLTAPLVLLLTGAAALEAQGPANVLLVVNDNSSLSRNIGEYYARRRGVPVRNICRIRTTEDETIARAVYDREIAPPVAACLRGGGLTEQVYYIVTTGGVPLRIDGSGGRNGELAAVDSELALLYLDMKQGRPHSLAGSLPNPFFNKREAKFAHPQFPMYMVARLAAYSFATVRAMIDRSLEARNTGTFVIDKRSAGEEAGEDWLKTAAIMLPEKRTVFDDTGKVLYGQTGVIGYASWGSNDTNRKQRHTKFQWLPGAIATEYVSTNARTFLRPPETWELSDWNSQAKWFAGSPQTLTADYLEEGASAATGHVYEPLLNATPRPQLLLPAYYSGRNLAESFYLSIPFLSWQNILVGDPLMTLAAQ